MTSSLTAEVSDVGTDREVVVDAAVVGLGSVAIAFGAHELILMSTLMPALWGARMVAWATWCRPRAASVLGELAFLALCTLLGGFNDWNSVVNHGIYDYTVPVFFPSFSTIPLWMLLFWGLILRFMLSVGTWHRLGAPATPRDTLGLGDGRPHAWPKIALQLALVVGTRQTIYQLYLDPVWSWLPFALAAVLWALLFGLDRYHLRIWAVVLVAGPLVEVLYIQVGKLHAYHLGWIGGVPLWIALWWVVALSVWSDLGRRLRRRLVFAAALRDAP